MERQFKMFQMIWAKYYNLFIEEQPKFSNYITMMNKFKRGNMDLSKYKNSFVHLVEDMSIMIYELKKYEVGGYDEENEYNNDPELNCCYNVKKYLYSYMFPQ